MSPTLWALNFFSIFEVLMRAPTSHAPGAAELSPAIGGIRAEAPNKAKVWFDLPAVVFFVPRWK